MRISITDATPEYLENLSRATRWRAAKRGWVSIPSPNAGTPRRGRQSKARIGINSSLFADHLEEVLIEARCTTYALSFLDFPRWLDRDDLIQECVLAVYRKSATPGFAAKSWRVTVMRNRLRDVAYKRRERVSMEELCLD